MKEIINIGIIGAGKFSHQHVNAIREIDSCKLVAACRRDEKELRHYCSNYGIKGYVNHQELLNDSTIDAVLIATPHHRHTAVALDAARAGKHILLEKPFAPTLTECEQINNEAKAAGIVLMLGHTTEFTRAFQATKSLLAKEELGPLVQAVSFSNTLWMGPDRKAWHLSKEFGGGYLLTLGVHPISAMLSLVNSPLASVRCTLGAKFHAGDTDDHGTLWLNFSNGVVAIIIYTGYTKGVLNVQSEFYCQRGMIKMNVREGAFTGRNDLWTLVPNSQSNAWLHEALVQEWKEFSMAIIDRRQPLVDGDQAIKAMQVIDAAFRSSAEKREIWL